MIQITLLIIVVGLLSGVMKPAKKYSNGRVTKYNPWVDKW